MKKRIVKTGLIAGSVLAIAGIVVVLYMFNMPHRNVTKAKTDYSLSATQLVQEYLTNQEAANEKYLSADGNSKILVITGTIADISEDFGGNRVILLKEDGDNAGVNCTMDPSSETGNLLPGQQITVKGVIRAGAGYNSDMEMYINAILEKCIIKE